MTHEPPLLRPSPPTAEPPGSEAPAPEVDLEYLVLRCVDLERSRAFYEAIGLRFQEERHGRGPVHYSCRAGGVLIELYPAKDSPTSRMRLGLRVSGRREALARVSEATGEAIDLAPESSREVLLRDPDGNEIALVERDPG